MGARYVGNVWARIVNTEEKGMVFVMYLSTVIFFPRSSSRFSFYEIIIRKELAYEGEYMCLNPEMEKE
jgi:hypothetical protein